MKRMTFDGRVVSLDEISHEHLSNIYWFNTIDIIPCRVSGWKAYEHKLVTKVLAEKWNSVLLKYSPHPQSKEEIRLLESRSLLEWYFDEKGIKRAKIYDSSNISTRKIIGDFCEPEWIRYEKISEILQ